jgi:AcrR family transcriptional regulator
VGVSGAIWDVRAVPSGAVDVDRPDIPTIEQIAAAGGIGVATIYTHFGTKYGLYEAAIEELFRPITQPLLTATEAGAYQPPDLRAEIISYVSRVAILARKYRHLLATYIQSYFETGQYNNHASRNISEPVASVLQKMITHGGSDPLGLRFRHHGIREFMDMLFLTACMRNTIGYGIIHTTRTMTQRVIESLLYSVDANYSRAEFQQISEQVFRLIPKEEDYDIGD